MGLLDTELAKWKRAFGLISGIPKTLKNNPANAATADAMFGLLGGVPGLGDYVSGAEAKYRYDQGDMLGAGLAGLGALPAVPNVAGMFIGKGAKTWDALKAAEAEKLLKEGVSPREIWPKTGTLVDTAEIRANPERAAEFFRQEIPDNGAIPGPRSWGEMADIRAGDTTTTGRQRALLHPKLSAAYPDTKRIAVTLSPNKGDSGSYGNDFVESIAVGANRENGKANRPVMLHELQHAIQQREGWAKGGSPEMMYSSRGTISGNTLSPDAQKIFDDAVNDGAKPNQEGAAMEAYRRLAGEAEARATQARMNMDMPQRLENYPLDSYDVPLDQLIVRGLLGEDVGPQMATVYHGSPHKFNKFDMSKIGTGEGAQAYGHGLYMAESPEVAASYQKTLATQKIEGVNPKKYGGDVAGIEADVKRLMLMQRDNPTEFNMYDDGGQSYIGKLVKDIKAGKIKSDPGAFYKVDIPDEAIPRMLDWDKPLSEQPQNIQKLWEKFVNSQSGKRADKSNYGALSQRQGQFANPTGKDMYATMHEGGILTGKPRPAKDVYADVSKQMHKSGIPGIRYLDGSSRTAGDGTSNFVLFDDQMPRILEVNGQPTGLLSYADEAKKAKKK